MRVTLLHSCTHHASWVAINDEIDLLEYVYDRESITSGCKPEACYYFEEMGMEHLPEYRGYLVGYLGGSLAPNEAEHYRKEQAQQEYFCSSVPV